MASPLVLLHSPPSSDETSTTEKPNCATKFFSNCLTLSSAFLQTPFNPPSFPHSSKPIANILLRDLHNSLVSTADRCLRTLNSAAAENPLFQKIFSMSDNFRTFCQNIWKYIVLDEVFGIFLAPRVIFFNQRGRYTEFSHPTFKISTSFVWFSFMIYGSTVEIRGRSYPSSNSLSTHNFAAILPGDSVAGLVVANGLSSFLNLYNTLLVVRLVLTWFPNAPPAIVSPLSTICDPYLNIFRGLIPPLGGTLDLSPILAFLVLNAFTSTAAALPAELPTTGTSQDLSSSDQNFLNFTTTQKKWMKRVLGNRSPKNSGSLN